MTCETAKPHEENESSRKTGCCPFYQREEEDAINVNPFTYIYQFNLAFQPDLQRKIDAQFNRRGIQSGQFHIARNVKFFRMNIMWCHSCYIYWIPCEYICRKCRIYCLSRRHRTLSRKRRIRCWNHMYAKATESVAMLLTLKCSVFLYCNVRAYVRAVADYDTV